MMTNEELEDLTKITKEEAKDEKGKTNTSPKKAKTEEQIAPEVIKTRKASRKAVDKENKDAKEIKVQIISLEELSSKEEPVENSDVLLSLFEITNNSEFYGLSASNKSRLFWNQLSEIKVFSKILVAFKSETLRKYWRLLSEISTNEKVINTIVTHRDSINRTDLKLLTIIHTIKDYLSGKTHDLDKQLNESPDRNIKGGPKGKHNDDEDESFHVDEKEQPSKVLKNKRQRSDKFVTNTLAQHLEEANKGTVFNITQVNSTNRTENNLHEENNNMKRSLRPRSTANNAIFTQSDKQLFSQIEIIVNTFKDQFPELNETDLWDALKANSFSIIDTYHYLNEPEEYEGKLRKIILIQLIMNRYLLQR
jgi:hypothetical protein